MLIMAVKLKNLQKIILCLSMIWTQIALIKTARLNVPRILLPYNTGVPTNYTLEVKEGNCYKWSSSRQDLVSVTPVFIDKDGSKCSTKAVVSVISRYPERDTAIIRAEDERTGQGLRCDVIIDVLHAIEIVTITRVLFLEDAPEVFEVVATNDQGGTFSSLEGVPFQWTLASDETQTSADVHGVLRFLKFADSAYKTPPAVEFWEKQNLHGSMILMEGSKTGSAKVIAKPLEEVYKHVKHDEVGLVIVANLNLKPAHVYLLPGTAVKFHLELIKQGKAYPISLPSNQYYLEVVNELVATLNNQSSIVTALKSGVTSLVVKDKSISDQEIAYLPSASIYVTSPAYMTLSVYPGDMWSLQENKLYIVTINIFDRNNHPIHITESIKVAVDFPTQYFRVKRSSVNGTYNEVQTLGPGTCQIKAEFEGVRQKDTIKSSDSRVTASQDVVIYQGIKVTPNSTLLPWDPFHKPSYILYLKASGGTGHYKWLSRNSSVAEVDQIGDQQGQKTRVTTFGLGDIEIVATDTHVTSFYGLAQVSVQPAAEMEILPALVEIEFDGELIIPLALYGYQDKEKNHKRLFSNCTEVPISVDISDSKFVHIEDREHYSPLPSNACRNIHLKCLTLGYSKLTVEHGKEGISLKNTCIIACHKLLKPIHPVSVAVLTTGSSVDVAFEGGPRPWPLQKQGYYRNMSAPKALFLSDTFRGHLDGFEDLHVRWLLCADFGENIVQFEVGNMPSPKNPYPAKNQASIKIVCGVPESVIVKPIFHELKEKKFSCPASDDYMVAVHSNQNLELELVVKDSMGRRFSNISSLDIKWYLSNNTLASLESYEGIKTKIDKTVGFRKIEKNYQELHPRGLEGNLKVTAKIAGYKTDVLKYYGITINPDLSPAISHTLSLMLVEDAEVMPKKISVFNTPLNKVYLNVTKGSGHFYVESSDSSKADVHYNKATRQIVIVPLDTGSFTVTVYDLCLEMKQAAVAQVQIYGISAILVDVLDKVELSKSVIASVEVLNEDKIKIPASLFTLMNLQPVPASNILSVRLHATPEPHHFQALYSVQGLALGHTNLKFVTAADAFRGKKYSSEMLPIQVFPPLHVNPDNITLITGAKFQILCSGGPQPQPNIEYAIDDQETAIVTTAGIIEAKKIGRTTLIARSVGQDKKGYGVVFSQNKVNIHVVSLRGIKIHTPLTRMQAGTEMPVYAMGLNDQETPFAFGTAFPELKFKWSINNEKVVSLHNVYKDAGIQEKKENNFCARIHAKQDGHVTLQLEVTLANEVSRSYFGSVQILSDEVQIQVFERLKISNPELQGGMVLLSPHSQLLLKCNRMGRAKVSYTIMNADSHSTQSPVVTVNEEGILVSSGKTGLALLLVEAAEDFGITQRMTVMVKVEEVAYLMIKPVTTVKTSDWPLIYIPVGFTVSFTVSHHNNIGEIFHATRSQLNFRPSRFDLTRISFGSDNNTLLVQTLKPGYAVLKVWDLETSVSPDYIRILAGIAIDPSDAQLVVGDVVCFGSPLLTHEGHRGKWTSDGHFLSIHPSSGGAVALTAGTTTITYSLMDGLSTATQVRVREATAISIMTGKIHHITNVFRSKPYHIPVVIQGNISQRINNRVGRNCTAASDATLPLPVFKSPFVCKLQLIGSNLDITANDIFHTTSGFDVENGFYYCSIEVINKVPAKEISILDAQSSLSVHLLSQDKPSSSLSQTITFPFLPAFVVLQEELVLSNIQPFVTVAIMAAYAVQHCVLMTSSDPTVLEVMSPETDSKQPMTLLFPVRLRDTTSFWHGEFTPLHLEISCSVTKQLVKMPVRLRPLDLQTDGTQCLPISHSSVGWKSVAINVWTNYQSLMITFICIIATMAGLFIGCRALIQPKQGTVTSQPVFLNRGVADGSYALTPPSHGMRRFSPPDSMYEHSLHNLSQQTRLWSLDDPHPLMLRRRSPPSSLS